MGSWGGGAREQPASISEGFSNLCNSLIPHNWEFEAEFAPESPARLIQGEQEWKQSWDEALEGLPGLLMDLQEVSVLLFLLDLQSRILELPNPTFPWALVSSVTAPRSALGELPGAGRVQFIP